MELVCATTRPPQRLIQVIDKFPLLTAARTAKTGLYGGLIFGLAQDALGFARGRRIGYVDFILDRTHKDSEEDDSQDLT